MPKEQIVIEAFRGARQSADSRDIDLQVASHMMDIDPITKRGELRGRFSDTALNGTAVSTNVIELFKDGTEGVIWDGTNIKHLTTVNTNPTASGVSSAPTSSGTASLASNGQAVRVGLGNGSSQVPKWVGTIEHGQFGDAAPSGAAHIEDAILDSPVNAAINGSVTITSAASADETAFDPGYQHGYRVTYEYDGYQDGPFKDLGGASVDTATYANGARQISFTIRISSATSIPNRVTALKVWRNRRAINAANWEDQWRLAERVDINDGGWTNSATNEDYVFTDQGTSGDDWESLTGLPDISDAVGAVNFDLDIGYQYNETLNGYHFVAKVYHADLVQTDSWMFRSLRNRPDMYNWVEEYLVLPTEVHALQAFQGRLYAFSEGVVYRIDPESFQVEDTIYGVGASGPESIIATERGMFFCNTENLYVHDGREIQTIGYPVLDNDYASSISWNGASHGINPIVTYDGTKDIFIALFESSSGVYHAFCYYLPENEWYTYNMSSLGGGAPTVGFVTHDGKPIIVFNGTYVHVGGSTSRKSWKWVSKEINNGIHELIPYSVFLDGDAQSLLVYEECNDPYTIYFSGNSSYDNCKHRIRINSQVRAVDGATSWGRWNKFKAELNGEPGDMVNTLGFDVRRVKLRRAGVAVVETDLAPTTLWWVEDKTSDEVWKATLVTPPLTGSLVGSVASSSRSILEMRVAWQAGYIFTLEYDSSNTTYYIERRDLAWSNLTTIASGPGSTNAIWTMDLNRGLERIFYIKDNSTLGYTVRSVAFDGTGDTFETVVTIGGTIKGKGIAVNKAGTELYWHQAPTTETGDFLKRFNRNTSVLDNFIVGPPLSVSGETNTAKIHNDKLYVSGRVPSSSEGIYEVDLTSGAPSYSLILTGSTADEGVLTIDTVNEELYYVKNTVLDTIARSTLGGSSEVDVVTSTTSSDIKAACAGVD